MYLPRLLVILFVQEKSICSSHHELFKTDASKRTLNVNKMQKSPRSVILRDNINASIMLYGFKVQYLYINSLLLNLRYYTLEKKK